eukprot:COSAG06_NODE_39049_length_417_cov_0.588050_1_plen_37_part_10
MWRRVVSAGSESVVSDRQDRFVSNHTTTTIRNSEGQS